jgi:hypothetical protein
MKLNLLALLSLDGFFYRPLTMDEWMWSIYEWMHRVNTSVFIQHKYYVNCPGIKPEPLQLEAGDCLPEVC